MYFAPRKNGGTGHIADRLKALRKVYKTKVRETKKPDAPKPSELEWTIGLVFTFLIK